MKLAKRLGAFCTGIFLLFACAVNAQASPYLDLTVECVRLNGDGTYTADLGFQNSYREDGYLILTSTVPEDNFFSPGEANRGQPTSFKYGRFPGQFQVTWDGTPLNWTVRYHVRGIEYESSVTLDSNDQEQRACQIVTYADCIMRHYSRYENNNWYESYDTYFSYFNPGETVTLPEGATNRVTHDPWCSGEGCVSELSDQQPSSFLPGNQRGIFHANSRTQEQYGNTSDVYWVVNDGEMFSSLAVGQWQYTRECDVFPIGECLQKGCQVEGQRGTNTAWFGYKNREEFVVQSETQNYYNSLGPSYGCEYNNYDGYDQFGRRCIYPQPTRFETGTHKKVFGVCFSGRYNGGEEGGTGEDIPIEDVGLNNYGYARWRIGSGWYDYSQNDVSSITTQSTQCNRAPLCTTGNYSLPCGGVSTNVFLQGLLSSDPDGDSLSYEWKHTCKDATLLGGDSLNPVLGMFTPGDCTVTLKVTEQGTADGFSASCSGTVSVSACIQSKDTQCQERDMTSTEVLLASGADDQRKLIQRELSFLERYAPNRRLANIRKQANSKAARNRVLAFGYPDKIAQCSNAVNCSAQSLSGITDEYSKTASELDLLAKRLVRMIRSAKFHNVAVKYDKRRTEILTSLQNLYAGVPAITNSCS